MAHTTHNEFRRWRRGMPAPCRLPGQPGPRLRHPSQREAARMLGVSPAAVAAWESKRRPVREPVRRLMAALSRLGGAR